MDAAKPASSSNPPTVPFRGKETLAASAPPPFLVALAAWLLPGAGYWLIGQRARGVIVGVTVILLFVFGLLVGGVRVLEVPYYDRNGQQTNRALVDEVRAKPWSIAQVMAGSVAIVGGWAAVNASTADAAGVAPGEESHARVNEIGVLYTAVAGMLNLLVIIDSAHRAGRIRERQGVAK
jgi:uncharacterized protein DUF6677